MPFVLFIIPVIIAAFSIILRISAGPFWLYCDPVYFYLFNGLNIARGISPGFCHHPGVPLTLLVSLSIRLLTLGQSTANMVNNVLLNPEYFLYIIYFLLIVLFLITSICLSLYIYKKTNDLTAVLLSQFPVLSLLTIKIIESNYPTLPISADVSPEILLISIMNIFNLVWFKLFISKKSTDDKTGSFLLSFISAMALATRLNFLPLLLPIFIIIPKRYKLGSFSIFILSFLILTLPVIHQLPLLWKLTSDLTAHVSFTEHAINQSVSYQIPRLKDIPLEFCFILIFSGAILIWGLYKIFIKKFYRNYLFLWASALGVILQFIVVARNYSLHYLVPGVCLFSMVLTQFYMLLPQNNKIFKNIITYFVFFFLILNIYQIYDYQSKQQKFTEKILNFHDSLLKEYPNCNVIASSSNIPSLSLNQNYSLQFGNRNSDNRSSDDLLRLYPNSFFLNTNKITPTETESYGIWNSEKHIYADDLLSKNYCIILESPDDFIDSPYTLKLLKKSDFTNAYLLTASTEKQADILFSYAQKMYAHGQLPEAFALAYKSRELHFQPRGMVEYMLGIIYSKMHNQ